MKARRVLPPLLRLSAVCRLTPIFCQRYAFLLLFFAVCDMLLKAILAYAGECAISAIILLMLAPLPRWRFPSLMALSRAARYRCLPAIFRLPFAISFSFPILFMIRCLKRCCIMFIRGAPRCLLAYCACA